MRFEVKTGGMIAILLGLTTLSGAVFVMGLRAGYDIAHESQADADKVVADYPLTAPPPAAPAQANNSPAPAATASSGLIEGAIPAAGENPPAPKPVVARNPPAPPAANPVAGTPPARVSAAVPPPAPPDEEPEEAPVPPRHPARKPFNIEIQAAMDSSSATQMIRRLQALGYQPHIAPTQLNGATWYKVEVGPYATQAEAAAAEADLRQKYNATYGHGAAPAQPASADSGADQGPEE